MTDTKKLELFAKTKVSTNISAFRGIRMAQTLNPRKNENVYSVLKNFQELATQQKGEPRDYPRMHQNHTKKKTKFEILQDPNFFS